jgi:hypothetical protein
VTAFQRMLVSRQTVIRWRNTSCMDVTLAWLMPLINIYVPRPDWRRVRRRR